MKQKLTKASALLATGTALLGSCCALPLLLLSLGVGSIGFAKALVPFRPYLIIVTFILLGIAFYLVYGCKPVCEGQGNCDVKNIRRTKILLWIATGLALLFLVGPGIVAKCLS